MWDGGTGAYYASDWASYQYGGEYEATSAPGTVGAGDPPPPGMVQGAGQGVIDPAAYAANPEWQQWSEQTADPYAQSAVADTSYLSAAPVTLTAETDVSTLAYSYGGYEDGNAYLAATGMDAATYAQYLAAYSAIAAIPDKIRNPFEDSKLGGGEQSQPEEEKKKEAQKFTSMRKRPTATRARTGSVPLAKAASRTSELPGTSPSSSTAPPTKLANALELTEEPSSMVGEDKKRSAEVALPERDGIVKKVRTKGIVQEEKENTSLGKDAGVLANGTGLTVSNSAKESVKDNITSNSDIVRKEDSKAPQAEQQSGGRLPTPASQDGYDDFDDLPKRKTQAQERPSEMKDAAALALAAAKAIEEKNKHIMMRRDRRPPPRRSRRNGVTSPVAITAEKEIQVQKQVPFTRSTAWKCARTGKEREYRREHEREPRRERERRDEDKGKTLKEMKSLDFGWDAERPEPLSHDDGDQTPVFTRDGDRTPVFTRQRDPSPAPAPPPDATNVQPATEGQESTTVKSPEKDRSSHKRKHKHEKSHKRSSSSRHRHREKGSERHEEKEQKRRRSRSRHRDEKMDHVNGVNGHRSSREHNYGPYGMETWEHREARYGGHRR
ncbi:hypothetical protein HDV00_011814 [Rhizophlyctis rosea]|nr:hypothetical protein HDV00_011814 [Rhizophlyctis rosea]